MERNVCGNEKIFRAVIGIVILLAGILAGSWWGIVGLVPLVTAFTGYCPINKFFHHTSCPLRTSP